MNDGQSFGYLHSEDSHDIEPIFITILYSKGKAIYQLSIRPFYKRLW